MPEKYEKGMYTGIPAAFLIMGALIEGLYEIYHWLRYGIKSGLSIAIVLIDYFHADLTPIYFPTGWFGAVKIVRYIIDADLWVFLFCMGLLLLLYTIKRESYL